LALAEIDRLEAYDEDRQPPGLYMRTHVTVRSLTGGGVYDAIAYCARDPAPWQALVSTGEAELLSRYERRFADATPKACCVRDPGHAGPHDVLDLFAEER
jgi:hypothetical protein